MKRYLAIFGFVFIGVIAGLLVRGIPIVLQVQAGGGIQADRNGDVNGDARLDMSDAVYLLLHIFRDGPQPVALAQGIPGELEGPLADIADSLAYESLKNRHDRFVDNGDQTVTDRLTNLMWADGLHQQWVGAQATVAESSHAGHTNWRLPTAMELLTIRRETRAKYLHDSQSYNSQTVNDSSYMYYPAFPWPMHDGLWSATEYGDVAIYVNFRSELWSRNHIYQDRYSPKTFSRNTFMVRDTGPNE